MAHAMLGWVFFASLLWVPAAQPDAVELRWRFQKGQEHKYKFKHREARTVAIGDQKRTTTTTIEYEWTWTVQEVDDQGQATLGHKFTALRVESTGTDWDFRYDSAQGNASQDDYQKKLIHLYDQLRFGEYRVQLRADGRVASVSGFDKLLGEINADGQVLDFHAQYLRDDSFAWLLQQALGVLPAHAVAVGDTWEGKHDTRLQTYGQLEGVSKYTRDKPEAVEGRTHEIIKRKGNQTLDMDTRWLNVPLRGMLKTSKLDGIHRFDPKKHALAAASVQLELGGDLLLGNENSPAKMKIHFERALDLEQRQ